MRCTLEQVDEAAVWMTLLHGSDRNEGTERGFRRWLAAHPGHPLAFEKVSRAHEVAGALPKEPLPRPAHWQRAAFRAGAVRAGLAMAATVVLAIAGAVVYWRSSGVATRVGEQRSLTLPDGTLVVLNTATRIVTDYDRHWRHVELKSGEALFEVAKGQVDRPFVVTAGGREITALGTSFLVRRDADRVAVTLMDGKVAVGAEEAGGEGTATETLVPGQRVTFASGGRTKIDRPALEKLTAWRAGHVEFDKVPLAEAVAEMNRYSATRITLERAEVGRIPITGIFRAGASASFANAVAAAYRLRVVEGREGIVLAGELGATNVPAELEDNLAGN